jgi:putative lipoprotein
MKIPTQLIGNVIAALAASMPIVVIGAGTQTSAPPALVELIKTWAKKSDVLPSFKYALVDLNDDGIPDAIVLITDRFYCGSGGCSMLIARGTNSGFRLVSSTTMSRSPIFVSPELRSGWHTLLVTVGGGGAKYGQVVMRFNGSRYAPNPSIQPYAGPVALSAVTEAPLHE